MNTHHAVRHTQPVSLPELPRGSVPTQGQWDIDGLTCASDATRLERHLRCVVGVIDVVVNPVVERAYVTFDESQVSSQEVLDAINGAGFHASW